MAEPENETPKKAPKSQPAEPAAASPAEPAAASAAASASSSTAQATAAVSNAVSIVRERLVAGEQLVLTAALVILVVCYLIFQFLLDYRIFSDFVVVISVLTILAIWIHRWGHHDFGTGYRILIGALGLSLALFAVTNLLAWVRVGGDSVDFLHLISRIIYWVSGIAAGYGAWLVFRVREA
jgi:hypothetical protein